MTFIWTRGDSCRTWGRDSEAWVRASTAADRGAKAAAGRLGMIVDRFFDGLVCVSTPPSRRRRPGDAARDARDQPQRL